jgi:hypothetical protein
LCVTRSQIGGERQTGSLGGVQSSAYKQERQSCAELSNDGRRRDGIVAGQYQEDKRHDGKPAKLQQRAVPHERYTTPSQRGAMCIGANPMSARNGATRSGSAIMTATMELGTPSSTIITRFSVPTSSTVAIPTET